MITEAFALNNLEKLTLRPYLNSWKREFYSISMSSSSGPSCLVLCSARSPCERTVFISIGSLGEFEWILSLWPSRSSPRSSRRSLAVPFANTLPSKVRWAFDIPAPLALSLALFSLNFLYVVVFGITSERNSRLSMRDTAVAGNGDHEVSKRADITNCRGGWLFISRITYPDLGIVYSALVSAPT